MRTVQAASLLLFGVAFAGCFRMYRTRLQKRKLEQEEQEKQQEIAGGLRAVYVSYDDTLEGHYEFGLTVGRQQRENIKMALLQDVELKEIANFLATDEGRKVFDDLIEVNNNEYPFYMQELVGTAEGAEVPLEAVLVANFRPVSQMKASTVKGNKLGKTRSQTKTGKQAEASSSTTEKPDENKPKKQKSKEKPSRCGDVLMAAEGVHAWGHNEDYLQSFFRDRAYLIHATEWNPTTKERLRYTAWVYPGCLPGWGPCFTSRGIAMSLNFLFPKKVSTKGVATSFTSRAALKSRTVVDVVAAVTSSKLAHGGMAYNIGDVKTKQIFSLEVGTGGASSLIEIDGWYFHGNHYRHLLTIPQIKDTSTKHRLVRFQQMTKGVALIHPQQIVDILGDTTDEKFPMFRCGAKPDNCHTVCTTVFDLENRTFSLWNINPRGRPLLTLPLWP
eukprot:NODE_2348_length_1443_cov_60.793939_g2231_i0.p1 GENE.NODE_2348_length_1443_cov_60.793939_g2231_i0~~NODE_2348_length_1443_cov_60.793939_g2231_i0.p1  ORF type:complete len:444 (+),score=77.10 NODE_2348_length_1443_cov_60.793939_g2231_i0:40-1371(+)